MYIRRMRLSVYTSSCQNKKLYYLQMSVLSSYFTSTSSSFIINEGLQTTQKFSVFVQFSRLKSRKKKSSCLVCVLISRTILEIPLKLIKLNKKSIMTKHILITRRVVVK